MATAYPSPHPPGPLRFTIMGPVTAWDPAARHLRIGERHLRVAPRVSVAGVVQGVEISASGVRKGPGAARWVVTKLSLVPTARETDPPRGNTW
jgi:hypothetical protein